MLCSELSKFLGYNFICVLLIQPHLMFALFGKYLNVYERFVFLHTITLFRRIEFSTNFISVNIGRIECEF